MNERSMNEKNKKIQGLRGKLTSKDTKTVIQGLEQIKEQGEAELIPDLIQVLESTEIEKIHDKVLEILNTLKTQSAAEAVLDAFEQAQNADTRNSVLASCWKNGLDYSKYFDTLIHIFIHNDFTTALEAFTVIENATQNISDESLDNAVSKIKANLNKISEEKKPLMMELTHMLNNRKSE